MHCKLIKHSSFFLVAFCLTGCISVLSRRESDVFRVYPGVRNDWELLLESREQQTGGSHQLNEGLTRIITTVAIIDLPFSFIMDTVLLPLDAVFLILQDEKLENAPVGKSNTTNNSVIEKLGN